MLPYQWSSWGPTANSINIGVQDKPGDPQSFGHVESVVESDEAVVFFSHFLRMKSSMFFQYPPKGNTYIYIHIYIYRHIMCVCIPSQSKDETLTIPTLNNETLPKPRVTTPDHAEPCMGLRWHAESWAHVWDPPARTHIHAFLFFPHRKRGIFAHHIARVLDDSFNLTQVCDWHSDTESMKHANYENNIRLIPNTKDPNDMCLHSHVNPIEKLPHSPLHAHNPHAVYAEMRIDCTTTLTPITVMLLKQNLYQWTHMLWYSVCLLCTVGMSGDLLFLPQLPLTAAWLVCL